MQSITAGLLNSLGDQIAQTIEGNKQRNWLRTLKFGSSFSSPLINHFFYCDKFLPLKPHQRLTGSFAVLISAPLIHFWYKLLGRIFQGKEGLHITLIQLFLDQVLFSPLFFLIYYIYMAFINGQDVIEETKKKIKTELIPVSIDSMKVWVPVQVRPRSLLPCNSSHCYAIIAIECAYLKHPYRLLPQLNNT